MTLHQQKQPAPQAGGKAGALQDWVRALEATAPIARNPERILSSVMAELVETHGDRPALMSRHESFTYRELSGRANRYARWALAQNLAKGDAVALIMPNRPEYVAIWLGIYFSRRRGVADQYQFARRRPRPLHKRRRAEAYHRRRRIA